MDKQINETLVSGTIKVRETRVFCFCDPNMMKGIGLSFSDMLDKLLGLYTKECAKSL